jgi:hypothetical protein
VAVASQQMVTPEDPADPCAAPGLAPYYAQGVRLGTDAVRRSWRHFGTCDRVEEFADFFAKRLERLDPSCGRLRGLRAECRQAGVAEGVFAELERLQSKCEDRCFLTGERVGQLRAQKYCELMLAYDGDVAVRAWTRRPVALCGLNYQLGCDAAFLGTARTYSNELGECLPYTQGEYKATFTAARTLLCDYSQRYGRR